MDSKLVAIVRALPMEELEAVSAALIAGGVTVLEFTIDHDAKDCVKSTCRKIAYIAEKYADKIHVGAGTVLSVAEATEVRAAGASLIISPNTNIEVIHYTKNAGMLSIPGAMSPTECVLAHQAGADYVKLFPAGELGIGYVKALMAPLRHIPFLIVGGITPDNIRDYLKLGVCGFGIGSGLLPAAMVRNKDYAAIQKLAEQYINLVKDS
ncbi:MAG: bifunctional 4-hydroxy-2-oxoglutarate aldolase/2-dehydro-3-deoxy-phosphogluconate aldolase [Deferribacteraceae bacterium]|nr:bifunctional 4-hydroxy-2-oxoglutarate aldolase/2-dehydro-3-deoxy-phosphogluconate aldolase [Deferribacteraceae bacterium]